jgi:xylulokinase
MSVFLGVDIGTSSSKGVLVAVDGTVLATAVREHTVSRPREGHVEMDADMWWEEFISICEELTIGTNHEVSAVGISGMGPCVLVTDEHGSPLRPAILYGVDTRATAQIERLSRELGAEAILERGGSALTTQSVGPKLAWLAEEEPGIAASTRRIFMPASWLVYRLTGEYTLDYHSASQCSPLFDRNSLGWYPEWAAHVAPWVELPPLSWAGTVAGTIREQVGGVLPGVPVVTGTIDAWAEALSVGADRPGDLMLMYGTTMFLIATADQRMTSRSMWGTAGLASGTWNLAGGMATSGAITSWIRDLVGGTDFGTLSADAEASGPGARGLLMLPYFAGERTPILDPQARGAVIGLTLAHTRGDLYRAALEATAMGVRHNIEVMRASGAAIDRVVAVGGGTQSGVWTQVVSDITGLPQELCKISLGASYGMAFLAAQSQEASLRIESWNPPAKQILPNSSLSDFYHDRYTLYRNAYMNTAAIMHDLAANPTSRGVPNGA